MKPKKLYKERAWWLLFLTWSHHSLLHILFNFFLGHSCACLGAGVSFWGQTLSGVLQSIIKHQWSFPCYIYICFFFPFKLFILKLNTTLIVLSSQFQESCISRLYSAGFVIPYTVLCSIWASGNESHIIWVMYIKVKSISLDIFYKVNVSTPAASLWAMHCAQIKLQHFRQVHIDFLSVCICCYKKKSSFSPKPVSKNSVSSSSSSYQHTHKLRCSYVMSEK